MSASSRRWVPDGSESVFALKIGFLKGTKLPISVQSLVELIFQVTH